MTDRYPQKSPATLGDVLYTKAGIPPSELEWASLVRAMAGGNQDAVHALYERAHRPVYTYILRITGNRETAEELTIDVFHDAWRRAASYDSANGTVLGWIMNQARSRAIDRLRFDSRKKRSRAGEASPDREPATNPQDILELRQRGDALRAALTALTPAERRAIEMTFFSGLTHAEASEHLNEPLGTVKTRIRSGLQKLRLAMGARDE